MIRLRFPCEQRRGLVLRLSLVLTLFALQGQKLISQEPVVARIEMKLMLDKEVLDVIEKGDLLTVLSEREKSYVIQTFNGQKGAVAKGNAVPLAEAVPIYDELIEDTPEAGRLYTLRASAHWAVGDAEKALADYSAAIDQGYDEAHAFSSRGLFLAAMGKHEAAIADYSKAIEKDPEEEIALINRASVYMTIGDYAKAVEDYTAAAVIRPENPVLYSQRAVAHKLLGKLDLALEDYDKTLELAEKDIAAHMGRGFIHFQLGKHKEAIDDFSKAIELSPESAVALNNRGFNHQALGQYKKALADFTKAVDLAPQYILALQNKGWLLAICEDESLRDPIAAIETAESLCELSNYQEPSNLTLLAAAHAAAEDFESAIGWQEKVLELATEQQKTVSEKILALYQDKQPLDPKLLDTESNEEQDARAESDTDTAKEDENADKPDESSETTSSESEVN
ncbi:MAG: tetratricopeptide repeat protein [Planctomycetota bacterium]